jgi:hypothetical protein
MRGDVVFRIGALARLGSSMAHLALLMGLLLLTSCISLPVPGRGVQESRETLSSKVVVEKREPNLLLAMDRTECVVPQARFERTRVGDRVFCHWR